jgi:hypothetical protein
MPRSGRSRGASPTGDREDFTAEIGNVSSGSSDADEHYQIPEVRPDSTREELQKV